MSALRMMKMLHRRIAAIAMHYDVTFRELIDGGLRVMFLLGQDATLCHATNGKSGRVQVTDLYRQLYEAAGDIKPKNISIDTLTRAFAGNEIDRVQVYGFCMHMQALAMVAGGSVTVLSHPSLSGINSGSGISGSTAWHGAFRFRQYLTSVKPEDGEQPDSDLRQLEFKKISTARPAKRLCCAISAACSYPWQVPARSTRPRPSKQPTTCSCDYSANYRRKAATSHTSTGPTIMRRRFLRTTPKPRW